MATIVNQPEQTQSLSLSEAAWVTGVPPKIINAIIDRGEFAVRATPKRTVARQPRALGAAEVLYIVLRRDLSDILSAQARKELYAGLVKLRLANWLEYGRASTNQDCDFVIQLANGLVKVELKNTCRRVFKSWRVLAKANDLVVSDPEVRGGEPVVKGTRIPVSLIADLREQGAPDHEILEDYPSLTKEKLQAVYAYLETHPRRGRPRKAPWRVAS
jgi:uncharacterized protein (DUF433 family)